MVGEAEISNLKPHQPQNPSLQTRRSSGGVSLDNFPVGSVVEVRTDEEGFKFVYFTATVIAPDFSSKSPKKSGRRKSFKRSGGKDKSICLNVEYHNLLANDNGLDRLKESVDISNVRPVPPAQGLAKGFELGDAVDAFYKDGWWQGVVSKVVDGGERFVVNFEDPPDYLECGHEDLRFHWDWINGSWVRPQKQSMSGLMFDVGRKVEVSFDREDSQDAWFPATIHEDLGNGVFRVEYTDKRGEAVKTTVDSHHVRPCPPLLKDKNFVLLEKVDAYFDYCWWSGVITKELENNSYIVFFKPMKHDREINQLKLRPHMDWKDGKWFTSSQETSIQSPDGVHHISGNSSASVETAPVKSSVGGKTPTSLISTKGHAEQSTPDNQQLSHITPSLKKRKQNLNGSGSTHSQLPKKLKEGNVAGTKPQDRKDGYGQTKEVLISFRSPESVSNTDTPAMQTTEDQPSFDNSWDQTIQRKQRNLRQKQNSSELTTPTSSSMKNGIPTMFASGSLDIRGELAGSAENFLEEHANEDLEIPIIIGLPCFEVGSPGLSGGRKNQNFKIKEVASIVNDKGTPLIDPVQKIKDNNQSGTRESGERRKRGRPKRTVLESPQIPVSGNAQNGDAGSSDLRKKDDLPRNPLAEVTGTEAMLSDPKQNEGNKEKVADGPDYPKYRRVRTMKRTSPSVHKENGAKESVELEENLLSMKKGRKTTDVQVQDSPNASRGTAMEVDSTVEGQATEFDNEPLSRWIVELNSPLLTDSSRRSPDGTADDCQANSGVEVTVGNETLLGSPAAILVDKDVAETSTKPSLPFVKNISLWKTVESMEVFQKIPQNPHFRPLEQVVESSYREGLALGLMVAFVSLVDTSSKLRASDPKDTADEMLETLANLKNHGFDVGILEDRISEFLEVKEKEEKLVCEVRELNDQIVERNHDSARIEEEMQEINEQIRRLQEKHSLVKAAKEKTADEVANLQRQLENTQESIENVRRNFKGSDSVIAP